MHIEYEISEPDFLDGQQLAIKHSNVMIVRCSRIGSWFTIAILYLLMYAAITKHNFVTLMGTVLLYVAIILMSVLNKNARKEYYKSCISLHGPFFVDIGEGGIEIKGPVISSTMQWSFFSKFFEDQKTFLIFHKGGLTYNSIPKRILSEAQVMELRATLERHLSPANSEIDGNI